MTFLISLVLQFNCGCCCLSVLMPTISDMSKLTCFELQALTGIDEMPEICCLRRVVL
jgi:hypothetical protein